MAQTIPIKERIKRMSKITDTDCWEWQGNISVSGYGMSTIGSRTDGTRKTVSAHRLSYMTFKGLITKECLDHLCENKICVNPDHLEDTTLSVNSKRAGNGRHLAEYKRSLTHCINGHEYTADNTRFNKDGTRQCITCKRKSSRESAQARRLRQRIA